MSGGRKRVSGSKLIASLLIGAPGAAIDALIFQSLSAVPIALAFAAAGAIMWSDPGALARQSKVAV
ncbi:MAG: hypothetical protein BMS9Abin28_0028 [Anaerolineae bacterium]|nr:MAG: hypothetical protein BMS9Abin28_0028 [Anaerolineae bacterium]